MEIIFAAACCSVWVSILLKWAKLKGFDSIQMIGWNYASASVLSYVWFQPDFSHLSIVQTPWWLIVVLGTLLPSIFLCLAYSLHYAGIVKTEIAQRLSVIWSLLAAYFLFQEQFNLLKMIGIIIGLVAVICVLWTPDAGKKTSRQAVGYLALVWLGYALVDILLKYITGLGVQFSVALTLVLICAFGVSLLYMLLKTQTLGLSKNIGAGLGLGVLNFANIALYVKAHLLLKESPAVVFAGMNIIVVLLGVLSGIIIFKENMKKIIWLGIVLGITSVACLAYTMSA